MTNGRNFNRNRRRRRQRARASGAPRAIASMGDNHRTLVRVPVAMTMGADGTLLNLWYIGPQWFGMLNNLATYYSHYKVHTLRVIYDSNSPMTSTGSIYAAYFPEGTDAAFWYAGGTVADKQQRLAAMRRHFTLHRSRSGQFTVPAAEMAGVTNGWRVITQDVADTADTAVGASGAVGIMASGGASGDVFGMMTFEMDVELRGFINPVVNKEVSLSAPRSSPVSV